MAQVNNKKRNFCEFTEPAVTVVVGYERQNFHVHPSMLAKTSKYFQAQLSGRWQLARPDEVYLPDLGTENELFKIYCQWLYHNEVELDTDKLNTETDPQGSARYLQLTELYILGDQLQDTMFRNIIMDEIIDLERNTEAGPDLQAHTMAFESTPPTNALCRVLIDNALSGTYRTSAQWVKEWYRELPEDFLQALIVGWAARASDESIVFPSPLSASRCKYHEHDKENPQTEACTAEEKFTTPKAPSKKKR